MFFPYRKILCPIDFDENSLKALERALELAHYFKAALVIIHVVPMVMELPADIPGVFELYEQKERTARGKIADIVKQLNHVVCESKVYVGDIVDGISQGIERFKPDLLVMATHGRTGLPHLFLGSVAEAVLRKASCPVLTIRINPS
jgi:universal stress protein A